MANSSPLQPGQRTGGGRFVLERSLGRGGMGEVWLAKDERLQEVVALKFLPAEIRADPVALDDLRRETARSHKLSHPNIVRIHDFHEDSDGVSFIAMEFVDGSTLAALRLQEPQRVLRWDYLRPLAHQLCAALEFAHAERVIHRDLKPANLMVDGRGRLKLADFGIAASLSDSVSRVSMRQAPSGTLPYMSPQQLAGRHARVSDDIYALGATLYELLSSKPPFYTGDITHQILHETPEPLEERLAAFEIQNEIPGDVAALIMACLGKEPAQRPQSARAVAEWIGLELISKPSVENLTQAMFPESHAIGTEAEALVPGPAEPSASAAPAAKRTRVPGSVASALLISCALLLVGAAVWYFAKRRSASPETGNVMKTALQPPVGGGSSAAPSGQAADAASELAKRSSSPFQGSLPGTIWSAHDSAGDRYYFYFLPNGLLNYQAGRGLRANGKWESDGSSVKLNINDGFAVLSGKLSGAKITGEAQSKNGQSWTWEATPKK